jgi:hypothetical protein
MEVRILLSAMVLDVDSLPWIDVDQVPTDEVTDQSGLEFTKDGSAVSDSSDEVIAWDPLSWDSSDCFMYCMIDPMFTQDPSEIPVDGEVFEDNGVPIEVWNPSWAYRTLTAFVGAADEQLVVDPDVVDSYVGWDDGFGSGVAPYGFVPELMTCDFALNDFDGNGVMDDIAIEVPPPDSPDDFVLYPYDFAVDWGADGLGCGMAPDGFVVGETVTDSFDGEGVPVDFWMYSMNVLPLDASSEFIDTIGTDADGNAVESEIGPVRYLGGPTYRGGDQVVDEVSDDFVMYPFDFVNELGQDGSEIVDDNGLPVEGWDPSWAYRTLTMTVGEGEEPLAEEPFSGWEDGLGCGVAPEGFVVGETVTDEFAGEEVPVEFVMYQLDPLSMEENSEIVDTTVTDADGNPVESEIGPVRYLGGPVYRGGDEIVDEMSDDFVVYPFDPLPIEDNGEVVDGGEVSPHVIFYSFNSAAGGGAAEGEADQLAVDTTSVLDMVTVTWNSGNEVDPRGLAQLFAATNQTASGNQSTGLVSGTNGFVATSTGVSGEFDLDRSTSENADDSSIATSLSSELSDSTIDGVFVHFDSLFDSEWS